jgi:hypothetical protein
MTLRVYAHWLPNTSSVRAVDLLDDPQPSVTQMQPFRGVDADERLATAADAAWRVALLEGEFSEVPL